MINDDEQHDLFEAAPKAAADAHHQPVTAEEQQRKDSALLGEQYMRRPGAVRMGQRRNRFYTKFVRWMRVVLPLTALGVVVLLITLSSSDDERITAPAKEEAVKHATIGRNELLQPRFDTFDKEGKPYAITAERAFQTMDNSDLVYLEKPVADSTMSDGAWIALESLGGTYNQTAQTLFLEGNVRLYHDEGYSLVSEKVDIDLKRSRAVTSTPVFGHGPVGQLQASGMVADSQNNTLIFTGPANLKIYNTEKLMK